MIQNHVFGVHFPGVVNISEIWLKITRARLTPLAILPCLSCAHPRIYEVIFGEERRTEKA